MSFSTHQSPEVDKSRPPLGGLNKEHQPEVANPVWQHMAQHDGGGVPSVQTQLDAGVAETEVGGDAEHEAPTDAGVGLPGGVASPVPAAAPAPVGPNACNTQAEEDQKNRFRLSAKSVNRFRPSSGYGMFDATYSPLTSLMTASVKMKFNFLQAPDTPDVFTLAGLLATGNIADVAKYFWTAGQQRQYESDYMIKVASMWSLQHTFTSSKACWPFTANPIVYPSIVQSDSDAHFMVDVHKMSDPANKRTSKFGARNPGTAGWQGTGELDENDVIDDPNKRNLRVARSERQRLDRAIATALASPILFAHNSKVIKPVDVAKLNSLATLMKQKNPSDPAVPLFISGAASAEGGSAHNQTLSEAGAPCYLTKFRDSCHLNSFTYAANGRCPERPASVTTTHKSRFVITPSNGWTAIRNAILASLVRYRALRLSELPCRLSGTKNHHFAIAPFP